MRWDEIIDPRLTAFRNEWPTSHWSWTPKTLTREELEEMYAKAGVDSHRGERRAPVEFTSSEWRLSEALQWVAAEYGDVPDQAGQPDYVVRFTENVEPVGVSEVDNWFVVNANDLGVEVYSVVADRGPVVNERLTYNSDWDSRVRELFTQFRRALDPD